MYATMPVDADNVPVEPPRLMEQDRMDGLLLVGAFVGAAGDACVTVAGAARPTGYFDHRI